MERVGAIFRKALRYDFVNSSAGKELLIQREEWKFNEKRARFKLKVTTVLGMFSDKVRVGRLSDSSLGDHNNFRLDRLARILTLVPN